MTDRIITTLGRNSKKNLREYFNNTYGFDARNIKQIKNVLGADTDNETWEYLLEEYNGEIIKKQNAKKIARYQRAKAKKVTQKFETLVKSNQSYFKKKQNVKENRKSTLISKFFQNYKKPTNMEKRVKYTVGDLTTFEKQFVDVYKIIFPDFVVKNDFTFLDKLLSFLGSLYRKFKTGVYQIDLLGKWTTDDMEIQEIIADLLERKELGGLSAVEEKELEKYQDKYKNENLQKISIKAFELTPLNYKDLLEEIKQSISPPDSDSYFLIKEIDIKFIKPIVAGCYTCKGHGKNFKFNNLTLHNPYSTNNNCLFRILEEHLDFKPNKVKCNEIREEFGIKENEMISIQDGYKIAKKYCKKTVTFITNDMKVMYGDNDGEIKIFCLDNHYMSLIGETKKCNKCGQLFMKEHICNGKVLNFYNNKVKRLIEPITYNHSRGHLNHKILHYDIETQYMNLTHQHIPYIVGYCYYKGSEKQQMTETLSNGNKSHYFAYTKFELIYGEFTGDNCISDFYDFILTFKKDSSEDFAIEPIEYINAYNGSGYDHYYLFREKITREGNVGKFIINNGNILSATIAGKRLVDLSRHLTGSLDSNLKQNGCSIAKGKIDHNLSVRWEDTDDERKQQVREYLRCDVLGLCELYEKVNEPIYSKFKINLCEKLTTSSNAFDIWRDTFLKDKIFLLNAEKDVNVRQAIYGARCYKNKNRFTSTQYEKVINNEIKFEDIDDYIFDADVVSLYPTAMSQYPYPIGKEIATNIYRNTKLGIYKITYKAPKNLLNPILPRKENKKLIWDLNDGVGWYSSVDIENAKSKGYIIKVITGYYWEESSYIFKDYIEEFYKMKQNAKKGTPAYNTAKLYLNGLYGKMLQRPNHSKDIIIKSAQEFWTLLNKNIIQEMSSVGNTWLVKYLPKPEFLKASGAEKPTQLGVFILAYSRKIMSEHYDKCGNTIDRLPYYYDTDSLNIHSSCLDKVKIDKSLGGIDDDVGGKVIKAIYIAPKMYAFQYITSDNKIKYHFRGKGVSNDALAWEDFEIMDKGLKRDFYREFQIKKINMKKTGKEKDYDHFSHRHIFREDTKKTINQNIWKGRNFIDDNNSVPYGFDLSLLEK